MKKVLLLAVFITTFGIANAQTEEGGWIVGATSNLGFSSAKSDGAENRSNHFNINAGAGYFLIDNFAAGLNLGFNSSKEGDFSSNSFAIGPLVRYYVSDVFIGASFLAISGSSDNGFTESSFNATQLELELGYPIWIVDNVAIEPSFVYRTQSSDDLGDFNSFGINAGFRLYF
ncbi:outer membrane beta-barrel protein [Ekhidna sp.]|uniref:outer membrane beta-barrel protein n=1 Tax=Ekhidna sp. TaxID=2608089 RepID=UPI003CCB7760